MNTRAIAEGYRMAHWAGIMRERRESRLSVKAFCENTGIHQNSYFYWQKKLREEACTELNKAQEEGTGITLPGFAEVKLAEQAGAPESVGNLEKGQVSIEVGEIRIAANSMYPAAKLAALLREVRQRP